jgi:dephospho-CoA kinase
MNIAITGNIGSGKSEVIKFLKSLNFRCISSDKIISSLYNNEKTKSSILNKLNLNQKNYKEEILKNLGDEKFNRLLKKVIYPMLYAKKKLMTPKYETYNPIFFEVPLLFEEKLARSFDLIIFIKADINKRKERVLKRGVSKEYFNLMNKKQFNENTKSNLSDFTIQNNGSILNLRLNVIKLLNL